MRIRRYDVIVVWDLMEMICGLGNFNGLRHVDNVMFLYSSVTHRLYYGCYNRLNSFTAKYSPAIRQMGVKSVFIESFTQ
jgi:hypothetical protein